MPELKTFDYNKLRKNDSVETKLLKTFEKDLESQIARAKAGTELQIDAVSLIDIKAQDANFMEGVNRGFAIEMGIDASKKVFSQLDEVKTFDVTGSSLTTTIGTDILPTIEALVRDTGILSRVQITEVENPNSSKQLWDFSAEADAENLTEVAAGTPADDVIRKGDLLLAQNKVQASTKFSEFGLSTMDGIESGKFLARLARRVQYKIVDNLLNAGSGVANGTARNGLWRGINNNYGVNGTGDASNYIGAITYATKAAADTALGSTSADAYDLCVKVKRQLLPANLTDVEEEEYVFIMNRTTWGKVSTVVDGNGRFKAGSAIDPATGNRVKQIDGNEVLTFPGVANDFVFLVPLKLVEIITYGGIMNLNDGGIVQLREGLTTYVSRFWGDGSLRYGHKYLTTTAATIGTTAVDNQAQNAFRYFKIS